VGAATLARAGKTAIVESRTVGAGNIIVLAIPNGVCVRFPDAAELRTNADV
jgi:hypothetical protein